MSELTSLPAALAKPLSHFVTGPLGASDGIVPRSSPPNGVPAIATAMLAASATQLLTTTMLNLVIVPPWGARLAGSRTTWQVTSFVVTSSLAGRSAAADLDRKRVHPG